MDRFYIKQLIVSGTGVETSVLDFEPGLNIVRGPSDTGKSYVIECIDFLFGNSRIRFDQGYDTVAAVLVTRSGRQVTLERKLDSNKVRVVSTDWDIESGDYSTAGQKNNLNEVLLRLIDIKGDPYIVKNSLYEKQRLTWRTFQHAFFIKETNVLQEHSILLPTQNTAKTAALSSLLYLITGEDAGESSPKEEKKIKEARKKAVEDFINRKLSDYAKRQDALREKPPRENLQEKVESVLSEIADTEERIAAAIARSKQLLKEIYGTNEQVAECNTLFNRYKALRSQYASDIKRLQFIVDGELGSDGLPQLTKCPFCDHDIQAQEDGTYIEATHAELHRIQVQLSDLEGAEADLAVESRRLERKLHTLYEEKSGVDVLLKKELRPRVAALRETLAEYREAMEDQGATRAYQDVENDMKQDLFWGFMEEDDSDREYRPADRFTSEIIGTLNTYIDRILAACHFEGLHAAYFNTSSYDIVVNGKAKDSFGKGYRAFLNTVLALAIMEYLHDHGAYAPGLLIVDSPILSLKEVGDERTPDTMKAALFRYLLGHQSTGQILILENNVPDLDYHEAHVITFTKNEHEGRYGFLKSVR